MKHKGLKIGIIWDLYWTRKHLSSLNTCCTAEGEGGTPACREKPSEVFSILAFLSAGGVGPVATGGAAAEAWSFCNKKKKRKKDTGLSDSSVRCYKNGIKTTGNDILPSQGVVQSLQEQQMRRWRCQLGPSSTCSALKKKRFFLDFKGQKTHDFTLRHKCKRMFWVQHCLQETSWKLRICFFALWDAKWRRD